MLRNFFKIALRNLLKYKFYSFINILGLCVGIVSFLFIWLYVQDELKYDQYHQFADRIIRLDFNAKLGDNESVTAQNTAPAGPVFTAELPEVQAFCRLRERGSYLVKYEENHYKEEAVVFADSSFFSFFSIPLIEGDPTTVLSEPNKVVISESIAEKYFGIENPMGKTLVLDNKKNYEVAGIMEPTPTNTHFKFDFLLSMASLEESRATNWGSINFQTYLLLQEGTNLNEFEKKTQTIFKKYFEPVIQEYVGATWDEFMGQVAIMQRWK